MDVAIANIRAHSVTLLRLAMHAESEHKSMMEDEYFTNAFSEFSDEILLDSKQ